MGELDKRIGAELKEQLPARTRMIWSVYIICCSDNSLYAGITTDLARRFRQHEEGKGAKYFRGRQPVRIVYLESGHSRSSAGKRETEIKSMPRDAKLLLMASASNQVTLD